MENGANTKSAAEPEITNERIVAFVGASATRAITTPTNTNEVANCEATPRPTITPKSTSDRRPSPVRIPSANTNDHAVNAIAIV